jgi:hypothetical protein
MSLGRRLRSSFSPYEIAVMGQVVPWILAASGLVAIGAGHIGGGMILWLTVVPAAFAFETASRCPVCGKPPLHKPANGRDAFWLWLTKRLYRLWPERRCSDCGAVLDNVDSPRP